MTVSSGLREQRGLVPVYARRDLVLTAGMGARLYSDDGRALLDFTSGIGVNALGYGHPAVTDAVHRAASTGLMHTSNLFRTTPGEELAALLVDHSFGSAVFFCNSGAEAVEAALKFSRRAGGLPPKREFVAVRGGFHGRTLGALSVTDRPSIQTPFAPLIQGIRFVEPEADPEVLAETISADRTAAVIVEPIQGEGGVRPMSPTFLHAIRRRCDETGAALIMDEIQCGLGRTGSLFAYEQTGVVPDILCLAKPLASGLPMGATVVSDAIASALEPGDHATTFGGGPFVASVALATVRVISDPGFLAQVAERGRRIETGLRRLAEDRPRVRGVRGRGLMWGIELDGSASEVADRAYESGLLVLTAGPSVVRLLPPLVVSDAEVDQALSVLVDVLP